MRVPSQFSELQKWIVEKSTTQQTINIKKMIHFGSSGYADFTGHTDEKRCKRFRNRNH